MRQIKLTTKLSLIVGGVSAVIAILSSYIVIQIVFQLTENRIKNDLQAKHKEVDLLATPDKSLELATFLRGNDLSLLIFDDKNNVVAKYGIYRNMDLKYLPDFMLLKGYVDKEIQNFGNYDIYTEDNVQIAVRNDFMATLVNAFGINLLIVSPIVLILASLSAISVTKIVLSPLTKAESIPHELKTPLTRAVSSLQVIALDSPKRIKPEIAKVVQELIQLGGNVDTLLTLSMYKKQNTILVKSSNMEMEFEKVRSLIPSNLKLNSKISKNLTIPLSSNFTNIILRNLLENACKYNIVGGYVNFSALRTKGGWKIRIENPKGIKKNAIGYGLGMTIVREICHYHKLQLEKKETKDFYKVIITG